METWLNRTVPEGTGAPWVHTDEGADDMPGAHTRGPQYRHNGFL